MARVVLRADIIDTFACRDASCAPPPAGTGGSRGGKAAGSARRSVASLQREIAGNKLSRAEMPQVPKAHVAGFMTYLKVKGIKTSAESVSARSVTGTQNEINAKSVLSAAEAIRSGKFVPKRILVSSDNKVVDGHHQWAAQAVLGRKIDITRVHAPIDRILQTAHDFNEKVGIERKGIEDFAALEFACQSAACAPPPAGTGGSTGGGLAKITPVQKRQYNSGYKAGQIGHPEALQRADDRGVSKFWKLGFFDGEAGEAKYTMLAEIGMTAACYSSSCAPPPAGTGGSKPSGGRSSADLDMGKYDATTGKVGSRKLATRDMIHIGTAISNYERGAGTKADFYRAFNRITGQKAGASEMPHVDDLFKGAPKIVAPFPSAGRRKGESKLPPPEAIKKALKDIKLTLVDPTTLKTQQGFVTRAGVDYYMGDKYRQTGQTYADPGDAGNRFPMVWKKPNGDNVILSGNHRFTAALIEGRSQDAIVVET